jgi:hypothetical protein
MSLESFSGTVATYGRHKPTAPAKAHIGSPEKPSMHDALSQNPMPIE